MGLAEAIMDKLAESSEQYRARRAVVDPAWDAKLRAFSEQRAGATDPLSALIAKFRGPQMPPAVMPGSLESIINGQRVSNPRPGMVPPPMIGARG